MDIVIVSTGTKQQEDYWQRHLDRVKGSFLPPDVKTIVVHEDWEKGAGNGFGTLYAYLKARKKGFELYNIDLFEEQKKGASLAIYHTAGQGTRLYPLTGSERGNKSAVKLPGMISPGSFMTILDAVIKQTSSFAPHNKGRLSVFWGDQLFIPSKPLQFNTRYHVELLAKMIPIPGKNEWEHLGLERYGLILRDEAGLCKLVDKCDYSTIQNLIHNKKISMSGGLGISLGSFSLSTEMTFALITFFEEDLQKKTQRIDSDPFFWMPTVLDVETYLGIMHKKEIGRQDSEVHYQRMQAFKQRFCTKHPQLHYFGAVDLGADSYWWDYGNLESYLENNLKLTQDSAEAKAMRHFFQQNLDGTSCLLNCEIGGGNIKNSVLVGVKADFVDVEDSLIINTRAGSITARHSLLYNVRESEPIVYEKGTIRADIQLEGHHHKIFTHLGRDGKIDWSLRLPSNPLSYEEIYERTKEF